MQLSEARRRAEQDSQEARDMLVQARDLAFRSVPLPSVTLPYVSATGLHAAAFMF